MKKHGYIAIQTIQSFNSDQLDFLKRRTVGFLDTTGVQTRSLHHLLQEAYLQGLIDAAETIYKNNGFTHPQRSQ